LHLLSREIILLTQAATSSIWIENAAPPSDLLGDDLMQVHDPR